MFPNHVAEVFEDMGDDDPTILAGTDEGAELPG